MAATVESDQYEPARTSMNQALHEPLATRPWLARLHPGLFAIALGLLALDGAWSRLGQPRPAQ